MKTVANLTLAPGADERALHSLAAKKLGVRPGAIEELRIKRRSLDARRKGAIKYVYTVDVRLKGEPAEGWTPSATSSSARAGPGPFPTGSSTPARTTSG